ncbi:hypothetical protein NIES4075_72160 [Tolypothrix sp. NIES-4075]|uniref:hypothetical protein n=1 Tax=Tolypothrix sp. NIES-4075 TaxID=2005459 RepID=UPI000B5CAD27|nr:hypothetical protein [Tolypothrix sp. NIES-4075]GAX46195.1 hypothetical protein NIES4075_72160 [Tolypothrix sp. NIES-4075]
MVVGCFSTQNFGQLEREQLALTYTIEILILAFALKEAFDFVVGLLRLWQQAALPTKTESVTSDNVYNFNKILALADVE